MKRNANTIKKHQPNKPPLESLPLDPVRAERRDAISAARRRYLAKLKRAKRG